ncbi:TMEM43 family protein [Akkermansiaceae bacterium]|nr:TMEM43 family protein [Akkermansiaceae bacterium]
MSEDHFSSTSSTGWLGRIGDSIKGVLFGLVLIVVSVPVLFFNEGRAVKTRKTLDEGAKSVVTVPAEKTNPANNGKLIHLTGKAQAEGVLEDADFGVSAQSLKLRREVEFYQWEETSQTDTKKKLGGGEETVTTYAYSKKWGDKPIDSSRFKHPQGHENPRPVLDDMTWTAEPVTVGGFTLSSGLVAQMGNYSAVSGDPAVELPEEISGKKVQRENGGFYLGQKPDSPEVGDLRVSHEAVLPGDVSVIAAQAGEGLEPYAAKAGGTIEILEVGKQGADSMFATAQKNNNVLTWILRGVGAFLMFMGFAMLFRPLSVLADVLPIAGDIVGAGTGLIALLLTVAISFAVISVAWIFYRPLLGIPLALVAVAGFVFLVMKLMAQRKRTRALA